MDTVVIFYNVNIYLKNIWYGNLLKKLTFCWTTSSCVPISVGLYTSSGISLVLSWGLNGHCHNILHCWYLFEEHFGKLLQELTLWLMYHFHLIGYRFLWFCIKSFPSNIIGVVGPDHQKILRVQQFNVLTVPMSDWHFTSFWNSFNWKHMFLIN